MAAKTISELANLDGRLNQQRQNSKWRRSSSGLAHDPHQSPLESQPVDACQHPGKFLDQRRAQQSAFRSNFERGSLANSPPNARLPRRADTTSTPSHGLHRPRQASIAHTTPNPALQPPPFVSSSKSSHRTPNSSVHASRVHNPQPVSSREPVAPSQPASTMEPEVIDLTLGDTEDELSITDMLVVSRTKSNDRYADPGPSYRASSSGRSSPIALEHSLFTPPPPLKRRARLSIDYIAVPSFPKGLTKAEYQPMFDHSVVLSPGRTVTSTLGGPSPVESPITEELTPKKWKGKERECDEMSPRRRCKQRPPTGGPDAIPSAFLDAFFGHTMIPLYDTDTYPPLTTLDLSTNTRFQFAHAWRERASRLREADDWMVDFKLLGKSCTWAQSEDTPSLRFPGTVGYVSSEQLRPWKLALPGDSPQVESTKDVLDGQPHVPGDQTTVEVHDGYLPLLDNTLPGPSTAVGAAPSTSTVPQGLAVADVEHDMHQYFNGLSDSPAKYAPPRQELRPTHTFCPRPLRSTEHTQMDTLGLGFPSLGPDPRLSDTGGHACFLGVPPSPPPVVMESSITPGPIPDSPSQPLDYFPAPPSDIFDAPPADTWSFEQAEGVLPDDDSPPNDHVTPTALGTIDPSLLGPEQSESQKPSRALKDSSPKQRSKLPEPVIYMRRPIDSSSLPLLSGKRPVQIKYRDSGGHSVTPSTQTPSNPARDTEQPSSDTDKCPRTKRHSMPSRKLREYHTASESDSDYIPEVSVPKPKLKLKRPSLKDKELVGHRGTEAEGVPTMSCCHQCRNRSARPKMLCSNVVQGRVCGKRFCNRCILYRYPDITFDEDSAGFLCPACTNTCNCSLCSRNRGEEFISMRLGGLAASLFKTKVTLVRDVGKPLYRTQSPPSRNADARRSASATMTPTPESGALPVRPQFWAHVYGMEGERMGSAFMTREQMEHLQARGPSPSLPPSLPKQATKTARRTVKRDKEREKPRGPRVFIGRPLESWKVRAVRDLEPSTDVGNRTETESGIMPADRRRRCYIGNHAPLYEPYGRMPGTASATPLSSRRSTPLLGSDGSHTSSELSAHGETDYWPQPDVGEHCSWAPPPPLGTIVHPRRLDLSGLSGLFMGGLPSPRPLSASVDSLQGQGSSTDMDVDIGEELASASTALSEEDMARVINAALAALTVEPPS